MAARLERDSVSLRQRVYCPEADIVARGGILRAWIAQPDEEARRAHSRRVRPTEQDSYLGADSLNHGWVKHTVLAVSSDASAFVISAYALCFQHSNLVGNHKGCPYRGAATSTL